MRMYRVCIVKKKPHKHTHVQLLINRNAFDDDGGLLKIAETVWWHCSKTSYSP